MSTEYPKIQSIFKRDPETKFKTFLEGEFSLPELDHLCSLDWDWYEKVDGTNIRVIWDGEKVIFGGRTDNAQIQTSLLEYLQKTFKEEHFEEISQGDLFVLYGEGYGEKIQKGGGAYAEHEDFVGDKQGFILFDACYHKFLWRTWVSPDNSTELESPVYQKIWLTRESLLELSNKFSIPIVPLIGMGPLYAPESHSAWLHCKEGFDSLLRNTPPEGLVCKPPVELLNRMGYRIITKVKLKDFPKEG